MPAVVLLIAAVANGFVVIVNDNHIAITVKPYLTFLFLFLLIVTTTILHIDFSTIHVLFMVVCHRTGFALKV